MSALPLAPAAPATPVDAEVLDPTELGLRLQPYSDGRLWEEHVVLAEIHVHAETIIHSAYQIGRRLIWTKEVLGHGAFGSWCEANLPFSDRTIRNYMRVATFLVDHPRLLQPLARAGLKKTLLLTSLPAELAQLVDDNGLVGEVPVEDLGDVPYVTLRKQVEQLRAEKLELEEHVVRTEADLRASRDAVADQTIAQSRIEEHADEILRTGWATFESAISTLSGQWALLVSRWDDLSPAQRARLVGLAESVATHARYEADALRHQVGEDSHSAALAEALSWADRLGHPIPDDRKVLYFDGAGE